VRYFSEVDDAEQTEDSPSEWPHPAGYLFATGDNFADALTPGTNFGYRWGRQETRYSIVYIDNAVPVNDICRDLSDRNSASALIFLGGPSAISEVSCTQIMETISAKQPDHYIYEVITSWWQ
jgi:hypothetical protein